MLVRVLLELERLKSREAPAVLQYRDRSVGRPAKNDDLNYPRTLLRGLRGIQPVVQVRAGMYTLRKPARRPATAAWMEDHPSRRWISERIVHGGL